MIAKPCRLRAGFGSATESKLWFRNRAIASFFLGWLRERGDTGLVMKRFIREWCIVYIAMGEKIEPPAACQYRSCDGLAQYELRYEENGTQTRTKWFCREHKNTEKIHDPLGISVVTRPHEIVDPRKVQRGDDE